MRSDKVHRALAGGMNRFEICRIAAKGVRATHKTGSRFEDSINDVLQYMSTHDLRKELSEAPEPKDRMEPAA
jgi:hypothetical protein